MEVKLNRAARVKVMGDWRMIFRPLTQHLVIVRIRHRSIAYD